MQSLLGDRFFKRFFGNRSHRHMANQPSAEKFLKENLEVKTAESNCLSNKDLAKKVEWLENKQIGKSSQSIGSENELD